MMLKTHRLLKCRRSLLKKPLWDTCFKHHGGSDAVLLAFVLHGFVLGVVFANKQIINKKHQADHTRVFCSWPCTVQNLRDVCFFPSS